MILLREVSRGDLLTRRQAILDRLGSSYSDLAVWARARSLVGDEWSAWDELGEIDFLLDNDCAAR